jgi:phosphoribosyl 1,2-cyclic phosphate phosphodiesterase
MLEVVGKLDAGRVVITHIEEPEQLSYDDLAALARKLSADGIDLTFAYDTLLVDV